ncbi:hypothetical protein [Plantactinospora sp. KBS50]|uniref:hypothetical protein n=1 Tax=Plantactinospora sp. KBS50 TaxID=2024580 RepID=UPI001E50295D|nr:hypothetical protein [Plantactinospora sp. KBS50]
MRLITARADDRVRAAELLGVQNAPSGAQTRHGHDAADNSAGPPVGFLRLFDALHLRGLRLEQDAAQPVTDTGSTLVRGAA